MIRLRLTPFSEHDYLTGKKQSTPYEYTNHLPLAEMDTAYYGIPPKEQVAEWVKAVPENFRFVMRVYSGISCQGEWQTYYASKEEVITAFLESMTPLIENKKLFAFLVQFSGTSGCTKENVAHLQKIRRWLKDLPIAIELRNDSRYQPNFVKQMLRFMKESQFSLMIVDGPQIPTNPMPFCPCITNSNFVLFRFHKRNAAD